MFKLLCSLAVASFTLYMASGAILRVPTCEDPVYNSQNQTYSIVCNMNGVTVDPLPLCRLSYLSDGQAPRYRVSYYGTRIGTNPDIYDLDCILNVEKTEMTCGEEYKFRVAAVLPGGASAGSLDFLSPITPTCR